MPDHRPDRVPPRDLASAYAQAEYRVLVPEPFVLRVGRRSAELERLHAAHRVAASAFVTACNPGSVPLTEDENTRRTAALRAELAAADVAFVEAEGTDPAGDWPAEPGFLVLGISLEQARALAARHRQHAIVFTESDGVPRLAWVGQRS